MDNPPKADTLCRCRVCQRVERVSYAQCLHLGSWPSCHGQVMEPIAVQADVSAEFDRAILPRFFMTAAALRLKLRKETDDDEKEDDDVV